MRQNLGKAPSRATDYGFYKTSPTQWTLRLTADQTSSSTTLADTALMANLPVGAYAFSAALVHQTSATGNGPRYAIAGSSGALNAVNGWINTPTSLTAPTYAILNAVGTQYGANPGAASTLLPVEINVSFVVSTAGTVGLRFAASATSITATLKVASYAVITAIGTS